jgi:alkylhydroperoxidase/carboxymuconolactone decarboxylase family protein YurZ
VTDDEQSRADAVRRRVLGPDLPTPQPPATEAQAAFRALASREIWGGVWDRPGLDLATRRVITMSVLVALGRPEGLFAHARGALADGMTTEQIGELVLHCALYCGAPAADAAFRALAPLLTGPDASGPATAHDDA